MPYLLLQFEAFDWALSPSLYGLLILNANNKPERWKISKKGNFFRLYTQKKMQWIRIKIYHKVSRSNPMAAGRMRNIINCQKKWFWNEVIDYWKIDTWVNTQFNTSWSFKMSPRSTWNIYRWFRNGPHVLLTFTLEKQIGKVNEWIHRE